MKAWVKGQGSGRLPLNNSAEPRAHQHHYVTAYKTGTAPSQQYTAMVHSDTLLDYLALYNTNVAYNVIL